VVSQVSVGGLWSRPSVWPGDGGYLYATPNQGPFTGLRWALRGDGVPTFSQAGLSTDHLGYTSGSPIVTSDGTKAGSALVWLTFSTGPYGDGQLRAYDAVPPPDGTMS